MKLYVINVNKSTRCDYWDLVVMVTGNDISEAKLSAKNKFTDWFECEPTRISVLTAFDMDAIKDDFVGIISYDNGSK